jgi:hypothetical protein
MWNPLNSNLFTKVAKRFVVFNLTLIKSVCDPVYIWNAKKYFVFELQSALTLIPFLIGFVKIRTLIFTYDDLVFIIISSMLFKSCKG